MGSDRSVPAIRPGADTGVVERSKTKVKPPSMYKVLLHNDDYTTMEFVVMVLTEVFHHTREEALRIMLHVHHKGVGVAGVYSFEIAETKVSRVRELARQQEFPLRCTMEPE